MTNTVGYLRIDGDYCLAIRAEGMGVHIVKMSRFEHWVVSRLFKRMFPNDGRPYGDIAGGTNVSVCGGGSATLGGGKVYSCDDASGGAVGNAIIGPGYNNTVEGHGVSPSPQPELPERPS